MKVQFIQSPVGPFGLGYSIGDQAEINETLAATLIEQKYAVEVKEIETATISQMETPETKKKRK
jgi:hypothetical protein